MLNIRYATKKDIPAIKGFILELAEYENLLGQVRADDDMLAFALFEEKSAAALIAEENGVPVGYAVFFYNFSTFLCKKGLFIEDIYITPHRRGRGFGKRLFRHLARIAKEKDCGRMEWHCLAWNAPSIRFYENLGAAMLSDWKIFRLGRDKMVRLAESSDI